MRPLIVLLVLLVACVQPPDPIPALQKPTQTAAPDTTEEPLPASVTPLVEPLSVVRPPIADEERRIDSTWYVDDRVFDVVLHGYVDPESTYVESVGRLDGGRLDTTRYFNNVLVAKVWEDGRIVMDRVFRKEDFGEALGSKAPDYDGTFMDKAVLSSASIIRDEGVEWALRVCLSVPDTDWVNAFFVTENSAGVDIRWQIMQDW